jgi:flagellar hook-basal body complex protein FliE
MSQMEINRVLEQIRSLSAQTKAGSSQASSQTQQAGPSQFATILRQGLDAVNQTQTKAEQLTDAFSRGTPGVELPEVMLAASKANISFHALNEVRNRLVSAYQDIMNMQM